jgi:protein-tyrosine phosphatase
MTSVLFVCLGNIIRSPAAEAIFKQLSRGSTIICESRAVGIWSLGDSPDPRMVRAIEKRGYSMMQGKRSVLITEQDFENFDMILAADLAVYQKLHTLTTNHQDKVQMMTVYSKRFTNESVPDPYYLDEQAFDTAAEMIEDACIQLFQSLTA